VAAALLSLLASFRLLVTPGASGRVHSSDADGYSISALGHWGFLQLLRDQGTPVVQLRHRRPDLGHGLLVVAEPGDLVKAERSALADAVDAASACLLVLGKRSGSADPERPDWIDRDQLEALESVTAVAAELAAPWQLAALRVEQASGWRAAAGFLGTPDLPGPVQLLQPAPGLEAWIECEQGVLLGCMGNLAVLADPDLLANHGLGRGANAALVLAAVDRLRDGGTVAYDETCHGHRREPSFWQELGRFPLVLVPVHLWLLLGLTLWIAAGRFGSPLPAPPALAAGTAFLIENTVAMLDRRGHHGAAVVRFVRQCVRRAAVRLHVPRGSGDSACRDWLLARLPNGPARAELAELLSRAPESMAETAALALARRVHDLTENPNHVPS
jgi:hypothetical protein